jgi:hypothetical protein
VYFLVSIYSEFWRTEMTKTLLQLTEITKALLAEIFLPEEIAIIPQGSATISFCSALKIPVCPHCKGLRVRAYRRCGTCGGYGFIGNVNAIKIDTALRENCLNVLNGFLKMLKKEN